MKEPIDNSGGLGLGVRLRAARERAGLGLIQSAKKLHLDPKVIEALESEQFEFLGAPVYVRGHLRRYAEMLGENPMELETIYSGSLRVAPLPDLTQAPHAALGPDPRRLIGPLLIAAGGLALTAAVWWVASGFPLPASMRGTAAVSAQASAPLPESVATAPEAAEPAASATRDAARPTTPAVAQRVRPVAMPVAPPIVPPPATQAESLPGPPQVRDVELRLTLNADSWVEVYDARGERLYYDVAAANSVQTLSGRAPLRVMLGNAPGVELAVNGHEVTLPAAARSDDQARFVISSSGQVAKAR